MSKFALYVPLEAKPGKEKVVADFLRSALPLVNAEAGTISWFAIQMGPSSFAIFDTFDDEAGRNAHLNGKVAALMEKAKKAAICLPKSRRFTSSIFSLTSFQNDSGSKWRNHVSWHLPSYWTTHSNGYGGMN